MTYIIYLLFIIVALGINMGVFPFFKFFGAVPNILLIVTVLLSLEKDENHHLFFAFCAGLFLDFYSQTSVGGYAIFFLLIAVCLRFLSTTVLASEANWKNQTASVAIVVVCGYFFLGAYQLLIAATGWSDVRLEFGRILAAIIPGVAYNLLLLYPVYSCVQALKRFVAAFNPKRHGY